ncbi:DUF4150 domain-containing protein [Pseudoalteromonas denitrificans]|uniref:Uncharacterized protein n=1 Tax=Pseudoalteromonas denitrificans DSM 6059 TaxID=1123010 RepID=A0A1I1NEC6_9GAMM|nr:DUF4150 domain-containing protein [Pseudoalteromonas denitrificans]SFC95979.1 protein of unknown function [Pseudoalteromonas denitrificans DSM 6059]
MPNYINGQAAKQSPAVHYDIDTLTADIRSSGSQTWRHNNPCLLPFNMAARKNNALGMAYNIAVFPDKQSGENAFKAHIGRPKYVSATLGEMIAEFIPDYFTAPPEYDEEKNQAILPWLEEQTQMDMNKPITNGDAFLQLVSDHLGWEEGMIEPLIKDSESQAPNVATVSGNNVLINGKTAVHSDSGGSLQTVDVCLTTIGTSVVPIPYSNVARSSDAASTASSVKINGNPACNLSSNFSKSTGDQGGDKKGVASGTIEGKAEFILGSFNVLIEGKPAVRQGDLMISNNKNTPPAPLNQPGGPAPQGLEVEQREALNEQGSDAEVSLAIANISSVNVSVGHVITKKGAATQKINLANKTEGNDSSARISFITGE